MALSNKKVLDILAKMLGYYAEIEYFIIGMTLLDFHNDIKTVRAVTNNILQIGELSKKLDSDFKVKYGRRIDWDNLRETRNLLAHNSENVSHKRLWDTATYDLRAVNGVLKKVYSDIRLLSEVGVSKHQSSLINSTKPTKNGRINQRRENVVDRVNKFDGQSNFKRVDIRPSSVIKPKIADYSKYDEYDEYDVDVRGRVRKPVKTKISTKNVWN